LFFRGLQLVPASQASLIHKTLFLWTGLLAAVFLHEKLDKKFYAGAGLLAVGNFLMLNLFVFELSVGALLILAATLLWAVENTLSKHALSRMSGLVVATGRMLFGSFFILVYLFISGGFSSITGLTLTQLGWVFFTSVLLFAYAYTWYTGLESVPLSTASCILLLGSPVTSILSVFSGAALSLPEAVGIISILFGVALIIYSTSARIFSNSSWVKQ
jgi:drug/metabolite transporter (DMT)-like permease